MRRLGFLLSVLLIGASPVFAQNWVVVDGTNKLTVNSPNTAVTIRQVGTGKVLTIQGVAGTDVWSVDRNGNVSQLGVPTFGGALNLGTTSTDGIVLQNTTASTSGATVQISPRFRLGGTALNSTSGSSETSSMGTEYLPATVAGTTTGTLKFFYINPSGTVTYPATLASNGTLSTLSQILGGANIVATTYVQAGAGSTIFWVGRSLMSSPADGQWNLTNNAASAGIGFDVTTDGTLKVRTRAQAGDAAITSSTHSLSTPAITAGTDATVVDTGSLTRLHYSATITPAPGTDCAAAFKAAALTADCNVGTIPAGQKLVGVYADVTAGFTCSGTCSGTKVVTCGTAAGGTQILASSSVTATATFGLLDADLGTSMVRAAAIQGGLIGSWASTTPVSCRFTSGTGNWGNASVTFVNAGSIKFTLITEQIK